MQTKLIRITDLIINTDESADSPKNKLLVKVVGRNENGKRSVFQVSGTRPYAFLPVDADIPGHEWIVERSRTDEDGVQFEATDGTDLKRVVTLYPENVNNSSGDPCLADYGELYEGDVPYKRRVSVDYELSGYVRVPEDAIKHPGALSEVQFYKSEYVSVEDIETDVDSSEVDEQIRPRVVMADIEAMPPEGDMDFDDFVDDASGKITAITCYDTIEEDYTTIVLDPDDQVDGGEVKQHLINHWEKTGDVNKYVEETQIKLISTETELDLLKAFIDYIEEIRPDLISGWNWVEFDHKYILNRIRGHFDDDIRIHRLSDVGITSGFRTAQRIDGLPGFDMMEAFTEKMTFSQWRSKRLDYVAEQELGVGKVEEVNVGQGWENQRSRFLAYNIIDVQLLQGMDDKHGIHEFFYELADLSHVQVYDTFSEMRLVDGFLLYHRNNDEILPTKEESNLSKIPGGLVLEPTNGVHEWVAVLDLKSLYPSVFITLNISRETLRADESESDLICPKMPEKEDSVVGPIKNNISFDLDDGATGLSTDREGVLPKYLALLFDERADKKAVRNQYSQDTTEWKIWDNKQNAVKVIMNSFYGVSQNPYYRLSEPLDDERAVGSSITAGGRYTLWKGAEIARNMGYNVRYGDTDSIMISLADSSEDVTAKEVAERGHEVEEAINEAMNEVADAFGIPDKHPFIADKDLHGNDRHCLHWEFEKLYRRFFQAGSKKRYAGLPAWKEGDWLIEPEAEDPDYPEPDITGFEARRADVPPITVESQTTVIRHVLAGNDFDTVSDYLGDFTDRIESGSRPLQDMATPGQINQPIQQYPNRPVKRAVMYSNNHLDYDWREGDDPWLVPIADTPAMQPSTDFIAVSWSDDDLPDGFELDTDHLINKKVKQPIEPILGETRWSWNELAEGKQITGVDLSANGGVETVHNADEAAERPFEDDDKEELESDTTDDPDNGEESDSDESDAESSESEPNNNDPLNFEI